MEILYQILSLGIVILLVFSAITSFRGKNKVTLILSIIAALLTAGVFFLGKAIDKNQQKNISELKNKLDYTYISTLNYIGITGIAGEDPWIEKSFQSEIMRPLVKIEDKRLVWSCTNDAVDAYNKVISAIPQLPFPYYYRGVCRYKGKLVGWESDINKAKDILSITVTIPFHHPNHDDFLRKINSMEYLSS